jgi:hypothetical protein
MKGGDEAALTEKKMITRPAAYIVTSASPRSFVARELRAATLAEAEKMIADEKADGWTAWISGAISQAEIEAEEAAREADRLASMERADRRADRAWKALRAAEARHAA